MRDNDKTIDPLPDSFETEEKAGAFWDAHSTMDYQEYLEADISQLSAKDVLIEGAFEEYDAGIELLFSDLVNLNTIIYLAEQIIAFPFDLFVSDDDQTFFLRSHAQLFRFRSANDHETGNGPRRSLYATKVQEESSGSS